MVTTPTLWKLARTSASLGIAFLAVGLIMLVASMSSGAQEQVYLEDAVQNGQVEILITGKNIRFTEPMLSLRLRNKSSASLAVVIRAGLELVSDDPVYADVIVGKESIASFQAGEERSIELYAFSLDPTRSFPPAEVRYSIKSMSGDPGLLDLLDRVQEQHAENKLASQLAVWIQAMGYTFEQLEDTLEVSLDNYQAETFSLLGLPTAMVSSPEMTTAPTSASPDITPSGAVESSATPQVAPPELEPTTIVLLVGSVALVIVSLVAAYFFSRQRSTQTAESGRRILRGKSRSQERTEERCLVCNMPLKQCTCAGTISMKREERQIPAKDEGEQLPKAGEPEMRLITFVEEQIRQTHDLPGEEDVLLSRARLPFALIPLPAISAPHALLSRNSHSFRIKDLNSSNGTQVNNQKLAASRDATSGVREISLEDGAQVTFGNVTLTFEEKPLAFRDGQGRTYEIPPGDRVIITRIRLPYIEVKDNSVSAPHALLRKEGKQFVVKDLNSGNGTQLGTSSAGGFDYSPISRPSLLAEGRRLRLGRVELELRSTPDVPEKDAKYYGPYRIISPIGRGGMARVFEGCDHSGQRVAIKVPKPDFAYDETFRHWFAREARIWEKLKHSNIVPILRFDEDKRKEYLQKNRGQLYIAMQYIDGCSLAELLLAGPPLEERVIMEIIRCVASALQYAHEHGVVHRDVKPNNILVSKTGEVFITDFGIARAKGETTIVKHGELPGAPLYMSPEQGPRKEGDEKREIDQRSDIYSLGVVIYQMITGRVPFEGTDPFVVIKKHQVEVPVSPEKLRPGVSKQLIEIVMRCLEKDPAKRYQNAQEIVDKLPIFKSAAPELAALVTEAEKYTVSIDL